MTLDELHKKVREWDSSGSGGPQANATYSIILDQLYYHASREWRVYLPAEHPDFNVNYMERLAAWIGNADNDSDQKMLLQYALHISFFSHDDFSALYRTAMNREIHKWIAEQIDAKLTPGGFKDFNEQVYRCIQEQTWFCPITDSMDINEFYKVNHLMGIGHRPGFSTLEMLASRVGNPNPDIIENIRKYMSNPSLDDNDPAPSLTRIVLLEDIVGSGSQCIDSIRWAIHNLKVPILFVPLILCPNGVKLLRDEEISAKGLLTVRPVVELNRGDLLGPERNNEKGWAITGDIEDLATRYASRSSPGMRTFGYKDTGCSLATFANTPDNTLPLVHHKPRLGNWEPLFPRVYRGMT